MFWRRTAVLFATFALLVMASVTALTTSQATTEEEVVKTIRSWDNAFQRNDVEEFFKFYDDNITVYLPNSPYRIDGKALDKEEFEYSLKEGSGHVNYSQILQPKVKIYGNVAVATYYGRWNIGPVGKARTMYTKETQVLVNQGGEWKIGFFSQKCDGSLSD